MGVHRQRAKAGYTIIEVMLFFAVTGALMMGILGSASIGVNTQRYSDAVNTFSATVQQEFTNVTNVVNTKSLQNMCGAGTEDEQPRGISGCVILGRLTTIDDQGNMVHSNVVGLDPGVADDEDSELEVIGSYQPRIDTASQENGAMNWGTRVLKGNPSAGSFVSLLIVRSPRSGNVYSYIVHSTSGVVTDDNSLRDMITELAGQSSPQNGRDQYMCIDRSGWVLSPMRVIKLEPFTSGPSGVNIIDESGTICH